jgi:hypothetical protein
VVVLLLLPSVWRDHRHRVSIWALTLLMLVLIVAILVAAVLGTTCGNQDGEVSVL